MNKKALVLLGALCLGATVGCNNNDTSSSSSPAASQSKEYKVGLGYSASFKYDQATVNVAVAAFEDGKILNARLDVVQIPLTVGNIAEDGEPEDLSGVINTEAKNGTALLSKVELGTDYNMLFASKIEKEVYEQIEAFAAWTVGKTVEEVVAGTPGAGHGTAVNDELASSVTIGVDDFEAALNDAYATAVVVDELTAANAGVGIYVEMYNSNELTTYIAGSISDANGKVEKALIDNVVMPLDAGDVVVENEDTGEEETITGAILSKPSKYIAEDGSFVSKKKLGEDYKMDDFYPSCTEDWYKQAAHIEDYLVGKTQAEVAAFTTDAEGKTDLISGATIKVDAIFNSIKEAVDYATKDVITSKPVAAA